jgi:hypothetical protein
VLLQSGARRKMPDARCQLSRPQMDSMSRHLNVARHTLPIEMVLDAILLPKTWPNRCTRHVRARSWLNGKCFFITFYRMSTKPLVAKGQSFMSLDNSPLPCFRRVCLRYCSWKSTRVRPSQNFNAICQPDCSNVIDRHSFQGVHYHLAKECANGMLHFRRHLGQELVGVQRCHADESLCRLHHLRRRSALQSLGLQSESHKVETTSSLLNDGRVLPRINTLAICES